MVLQNLVTDGYQSKEAKLFFLKQKADKVVDFIKGLRQKKSIVYHQIINGDNSSIEDRVVTLQSFLLQVALYYRKCRALSLIKILEINRGYHALELWYKDTEPMGVLTYLLELKHLFDLVKE